VAPDFFLGGYNPLAEPRPQLWLVEFFSCLLPACNGAVVTLGSEEFNLATLQHWATAVIHPLHVKPEAAAGQATKLLSVAVNAREKAYLANSLSDTTQAP
jgi:hypothetical protein